VCFERPTGGDRGWGVEHRALNLKFNVPNW